MPFPEWEEFLDKTVSQVRFRYDRREIRRELTEHLEDARDAAADRGEADPAAAYLGDVYTVPVNIAGLPAISVPCGNGGSGLPIGMQLIGRPFCEETLLSLAEIYEKECGR